MAPPVIAKAATDPTTVPIGIMDAMIDTKQRNKPLTLPAVSSKYSTLDYTERTDDCVEEESSNGVLDNDDAKPGETIARPSLPSHPLTKKGSLGILGITMLPGNTTMSTRARPMVAKSSSKTFLSFRSNATSVSSVEKEEDIRRAHNSGFIDRTQAREKLDGFFEKSLLEKVRRDLPTFNKAELHLGKFLGRGAFSSVDEIRQVLSSPTKLRRTNSVAVGNKESRAFISDHCMRPGGDARYAVKTIRRDVLKDSKRCWVGIVDLVVETRFLSNLDHPNIIKLRGIASGEPLSTDYFFILDRLHCTLQTRLTKWGWRRKKQNTLFGRLNGRNKLNNFEFLEERLASIFDLSAALEYMHANHIIHRDIKPDNIGFDVRDDIKIFDFGLAREMTEHERAEDGTYNFSQMTGSLRYMAPEVALGHPYNAAADVYSFTIVAWEMLALEKPFNHHKSESDFVSTVFEGKKRPFMNEKSGFSPACKSMMEAGWNPDFRKRLSMYEFNQRLRRELVGLRHGDATGIDHQRRRSTFIFERLRRPSISSQGSHSLLSLSMHSALSKHSHS